VSTELRCDLCANDPRPCRRHALESEITAAMRGPMAEALDAIGRPDLAATTREYAAPIDHRGWYRALCWARDRWAIASELPTPDVAARRVVCLAWGVRGMLLRTNQSDEARAFWRECVAEADDVDPVRATRSPVASIARGAQLALAGVA